VALRKKVLESESGIVGKYSQIRDDEDVRAFIELADEAMAAIGYTEHGMRHVSVVAENAGMILEKLGYDAEMVELARIAGLLHDIGNMIARADHPQSAAGLVYPILKKYSLTPRQIGLVIGAIGNHEEDREIALNPVTAALIIADKADVHRSRVRHYNREERDIHDDVNYACVESMLSVDPKERELRLSLKIDTHIASVMEYFEIFTERMLVTKRSAEYLGLTFRLLVNGTELT